MKRVIMTKTAVLISTLNFVGAGIVSAQQRVSDGTAPATISPNAILELQSNNKGMLLPRVALTATTNAAPLSAHVAGMYVYNTATAGDVTPGSYYNDGIKWHRVADAALEPWYNEATNKGATANNQNIYQMANVGIGTTTPDTRLDINNGTTNGAIKIVDGTQGAGKVLTSDANGVGKWTADVTTLYFLTTNLSGFSGGDFQVTTNPATGASGTPDYKFLKAQTAANLGPGATYTTNAVSYTIPSNGYYRVTLYSDQVDANSKIAVVVYRAGSILFGNYDFGQKPSANAMINIWNLQAGDIVVPTHYTPTGTIQETTFSVERVK